MNLPQSLSVAFANIVSDEYCFRFATLTHISLIRAHFYINDIYINYIATTQNDHWWTTDLHYILPR